MSRSVDGAVHAQPILRIVVPVLNEGPALTQRLIALQPLRARGAQVVVVDGGSVDACTAGCERWSDGVIEAPRGRSRQMNAGARASLPNGPADILLFLHADTALPDRADACVREAVERGAAWGRFDVRIDGPSPLLRVVSMAMNARSRWTGIATGDQAIFMQAHAFAALGGFPELDLMEDIEMSRRLKRIGRCACLTERVSTSARRWQRHGVWRTIWLMWWLRAAYFFGADPQDLAVRYGYRPRTAGENGKSDEPRRR